MVFCQLCVLNVSWTHLFFPSPPLLCHCLLDSKNLQSSVGLTPPPRQPFFCESPARFGKHKSAHVQNLQQRLLSALHVIKQAIEQSLLTWPTKISLSSFIFHLPLLSLPALCFVLVYSHSILRFLHKHHFLWESFSASEWLRSPHYRLSGQRIHSEPLLQEQSYNGIFCSLINIYFDPRW